MKKIILAIILYITALANATNVCNTEYHPIMENGKVWYILNIMHKESSKKDYLTKVWIAGDSIIDGTIVKKIAKQDLSESSITHYTIIKEENKQLFFLFKDDSDKIWCPILDFNCSKDDNTIPLFPGNYDGSVDYCLIRDEGIITLSEKKYRYLKVESHYSHYWIEGVGSPDMFILTIFPAPTYDLNIPISQRLESCYLNDELIYTYDEFSNALVSSIDNSIIGNSSRFIKHDIFGQKIYNPLPGTIYIQNGKKFIMK